MPAPALVLLAIASVQIGSALARDLIRDLGAPAVTLLRVGLASLILSAAVRPKTRAWTRASWWPAAVLGLSMAGMNLSFYLALNRVPLGIAVTVEFVGPLTLALVRTRRWVDVVWAAFAAGGVALLGLDTNSGVPLSGLAFALLAGSFWALYIVASTRVGRVVPGVDGLAVALGVATLAVVPFGVAGAAEVIDRPGLLVRAAAVAVLSSVFSYGLELTALRRMSVQVFGILMSLEPAAAALAGLVVLDQELGARQLVALVLVSVASAGITLGHREGELPPQPLE